MHNTPRPPDHPNVSSDQSRDTKISTGVLWVEIFFFTLISSFYFSLVFTLNEQMLCVRRGSPQDPPAES